MKERAVLASAWRFKLAALTAALWRALPSTETVFLMPFCAALILARVSAECLRPSWAALSFARCSGERAFPSRATPTLSLCQSAIFFPLWAAPILALCSAVNRLAVRDLRMRSMVSGVCVYPAGLPATGTVLYPPEQASSLSSQYCSRSMSLSIGASSITKNRKALSPSVPHSACNFAEWCRWYRRSVRCSLQRFFRLNALPTYTFPVTTCWILYTPLCITSLYHSTTT